MATALAEFEVVGVATNIEFLGRIVKGKAFASGDDADDLHGLPGGLDGTAEPDAVPTLHHSGPGSSDAEQESAVGEFLQAQCGGGQ